MSKPVRGSNSAPMGVVSDAVIREQARLAFADKVQSGVLEGSAVQRLAYAVTAEHFTMAQTSDKPPALEAVLPSADKAASAEATKTLFDIMLAFFSPKPAVKETGSSERIEAAKDSQKAREQLLKRALQVAAILARGRVPLSAFDASTGTFTVPCKLLLLPGEKARGRIAEQPSVALDGRPILFTRKATDGSNDDVDDKAQASVARLVKVCAPPQPRISRTGAPVGLDKMASEVARILTTDTATVALTDMSDALRNSITAIVQWWDTQNQAASDKANKANNGTKPKAA